MFIMKISDIQNKIEKVNVGILGDGRIRDKQYLFYFLYRIICKYRKILERVDVKEILKGIYAVLNINSYDNKCFPLINRLTDDEKELNFLLLGTLSLFYKYFNEEENLPETPDSKNFEDFVSTKVYQKNIIENDLIKLALLVPNLSRPRTLAEIEQSDLDKEILDNLLGD